MSSKLKAATQVLVISTHKWELAGGHFTLALGSGNKSLSLLLEREGMLWLKQGKRSSYLEGCWQVEELKLFYKKNSRPRRLSWWILSTTLKEKNTIQQLPGNRKETLPKRCIRPRLLITKQDKNITWKLQMPLMNIKSKILNKLK